MPKDYILNKPIIKPHKKPPLQVYNVHVCLASQTITYLKNVFSGQYQLSISSWSANFHAFITSFIHDKIKSITFHKYNYHIN